MGSNSKLECPDCGLTISRKNLSNHYRRMHPGLDPRIRLKETRKERPQREIREIPIPPATIVVVTIFVVAILIVVGLLAMSFIQDGKSSVPKPKNAFYAANDGAVINGTFYPADESGASTIYLIHDVGDDRTVWTETAEWFQDLGYNVMTIDLRGHGESTLNIKTVDITYDWTTMSAEEMSGIELDLRGAYDWAHGSDQNGNMNTEAGEMGMMIGIGRGGLLAMNQASRMPREFVSVVILSPLLDVYNLDVDQLFEDYGDLRPVMLACSEDDTFGKMTTERILERKEEDGEENGVGIFVPGNARGVDLLENDDLKESILDIIDEGWEHGEKFL